MSALRHAAAGILAIGVWALSVAAAVPAASGPATPLPAPVMREIKSLFEPPGEPVSQKDVQARMEKVIDLGTKAEADYPQASDLSEVRFLMFRAASWLAGVKGDEASRKQLQDLAQRIAASDATPQEKVTADFFVTHMAILSAASASRPAGAAETIRAFAGRYANTDAEAQSLVHAAILAEQAEEPKLREEYLAALEGKYGSDPAISRFLRRSGRSPNVGKPFQAELTRLDGGKLVLPKDLLGKVVIIDFWATWCGPCVAALPHMKQVYAAYKQRGVEIVGVSLDTSRPKLEEFIRKNDVGWVHTFTGKGWNDPTAQAYGVAAIPSLWVVGKDGKIVSDEARGNLEQVLERALGAADSRPAREAPK